MRVAKFGKSRAKWTGFLAVVEEGSKFGFGCRGEDLSHDMTEDVNGAIGLVVGVGFGG